MGLNPAAYTPAAYFTNLNHLQTTIQGSAASLYQTQHTSSLERGRYICFQPLRRDSVTRQDRQSAAKSATPGTSRMARSTAKQAPAIITGTSPNACRLRILITKMDKGLQQSITEKEIGDDIHQKFQQLTTKKVQANFTDRKRLTNARVITTEDVIKLREKRESANAENAAKALIRNEKKRSREEQPSKKGKKAVTISNNIIVHNIGIEDSATMVVVEEEEWVSINDFNEPPPPPPPPSGKRVNKAWEKAQRT